MLKNYAFGSSRSILKDIQPRAPHRKAKRGPSPNGASLPPPLRKMRVAAHSLSLNILPRSPHGLKSGPGRILVKKCRAGQMQFASRQRHLSEDQQKRRYSILCSMHLINSPRRCGYIALKICNRKANILYRYIQLQRASRVLSMITVNG